jgi:hypothetical protein
MVTTWYPFLPLNNYTSEMRNVWVYRVCICVGRCRGGSRREGVGRGGGGQEEVCVWDKI